MFKVCKFLENFNEVKFICFVMFVFCVFWFSFFFVFYDSIGLMCNFVFCVGVFSLGYVVLCIMYVLKFCVIFFYLESNIMEVFRVVMMVVMKKFGVVVFFNSVIFLCMIFVFFFVLLRWNFFDIVLLENEGRFLVVSIGCMILLLF